VPPAGKYQVSARPTLNLRGGPATTFDVKKEVENGTFVTVLGFVDGQHGKWALIDLEDDGVRDGFVFASYLAPSS
jgi:uncharacterized protein YgiM (DUF1202 family)